MYSKAAQLGSTSRTRTTASTVTTASAYEAEEKAPRDRRAKPGHKHVFIYNLPAPVLERIRIMAIGEHRSLNSQLIHLLDVAARA